MNASGFMGLHMITAGSYDGEAYLEQDDEHYKLLVTRDNRLVGFILIGDVAPRRHLHLAHPRADPARHHRL